MSGGTVAQTVAPTIFGLDAHGGHRFESGPMSFLLSTPHLFSLSFPVPLFTNLSIKGITAQTQIFTKKETGRHVCMIVSDTQRTNPREPKNVNSVYRPTHSLLRPSLQLD